MRGSEHCNTVKCNHQIPAGLQLAELEFDVMLKLLLYMASVEQITWIKQLLGILNF